MPIYEYQCRLCQHSLDTLQKMSDAPLVDCPACHQPGLAKMVSAAGFQLKGQGWYATDFKEKAKASTGQADAPAEKKPVTPEATS